MKKIILLFLCGAGINHGFSQVYQQTFSTDAATVTNGTMSDPNYVGEPPSSTQVSYLGAPTSGSVGVSGGTLSITTGSTSSRFAVARTQASETYGALKFKFDANITVGSSGSSGSKFQFYAGSGLTNNTTLDANSSIHSGFAIRYQNSSYYYVGTVGSAPTVLTTQFTDAVNRTFTFVTNNSGASIDYTAPDGTTEAVGDDKWDLWVDLVKVYDEQGALTNATAINSFKFGDLNGNNGRGNLLIDNFSVTDLTAPLPVALSSFKAITKSNTIELSWTTANEINVSRYDVERSDDGVAFDKVSSVAARNNTAAQQYTSVDAAPLSGNNFYRIKSIDKDGSYQYSSIIKVSRTTKSEMTVVPNPVENRRLNLQLNHLQKGRYSLKIVSVAGQVVYQKNIEVESGSTVQSIQLPGIHKGSYFLQLSNGATNQRSKIFIQ